MPADLRNALVIALSSSQIALSEYLLINLKSPIRSYNHDIVSCRASTVRMGMSFTVCGCQLGGL